MTTLLIRHETPLGPRTRIIREDDEERARETMILFQSQGAEVVMSDMAGRKTIPELVKEREKKLARSNRKRKIAAVIDLNSRRG